jgi:hypothetical protein
MLNAGERNEIKQRFQNLLENMDYIEVDTSLAPWIGYGQRKQKGFCLIPPGDCRYFFLNKGNHREIVCEIRGESTPIASISSNGEFTINTSVNNPGFWHYVFESTSRIIRREGPFTE